MKLRNEKANKTLQATPVGAGLVVWSRRPGVPELVVRPLHASTNANAMKCFLSRSFRPEDDVVTNWFREFLQAFPKTEVVEARDDPRAPLEQVEQKMARCHLVCAVVTSRDGAVPQWVSTEIGMARSLRKPIFAFVEDGIRDLGGLKSMMEFKTFRRDCLGVRTPEFIRYTFSARSLALDSLGVTRSELLVKLDGLRDEVRLLEAARDRFDEI